MKLRWKACYACRNRTDSRHTSTHTQFTLPLRLNANFSRVYYLFACIFLSLPCAQHIFEAERVCRYKHSQSSHESIMRNRWHFPLNKTAANWIIYSRFRCDSVAQNAKLFFSVFSACAHDVHASLIAFYSVDVGVVRFGALLQWLFNLIKPNRFNCTICVHSHYMPSCHLCSTRIVTQLQDTLLTALDSVAAAQCCAVYLRCANSIW